MLVGSVRWVYETAPRAAAALGRRRGPPLHARLRPGLDAVRPRDLRAAAAGLRRRRTDLPDRMVRRLGADRAGRGAGAADLSLINL